MSNELRVKVSKLITHNSKLLKYALEDNRANYRYPGAGGGLVQILRRMAEDDY